MNSIILSYIVSFGKKLARAFDKSVLNRTITAIYGFFSRCWEKSGVISLLKNEPPKKNGILSGIMYSPVTLFEFLNKKIGGWLSKRIEESFVLDLARVLMNNILALNTKFLGCLLLSGVTVRGLVTLNFGKFSAVISVAGVLLVLMKYNIIDFFDSSKLVDFCKKTFGLEYRISDIYKKDYPGTRKSIILAILIGAGLGTISPIYSMLILSALVGVSVVFSYPIAGVFVAVIAAPFVPTMLLAGICILTTGAFLVKAVCDSNFVWRKEGIGIGFFLFLLFVSSLFSFSPVKSLMVWAMYFVFTGFYFIIVNTIRTKEQAVVLLKIFVLCGALVAVYGILQYVFGWNVSNAWIDEEMFEDATMRVYSTMENPNVLGEYLLLVIPLAAVFFLKKETGLWQRTVYAGIFLASCLCMIFTQSRGCWLGVVLAAAIFITFYNGKLWALVPFALLALPFVIPETMIDRMMSVGNLEDSSTSYRVFIWKGTFRMLRDFWIGGIGMGEGAFRSVYPVYSYIGIIAPHAHNTFLQLLVEGGIGVLLVFLGMMVSFIRKISAAFKGYTKYSEESLSLLAIGSGIGGFLLQSMFDYTFYNYRMMAMFFMILGIGAALKACKGEEK